MSYTQNKDGYAIETTLADGTTIDDTGDTAYKLGALATKNVWPSPKFNVYYTAPAVGASVVAAGGLWKSHADLRGMLTLMVQNGIPILLAMGKSSTAGAGPYTHTITERAGARLPSVVFHHEERGSGTTEEYQFLGCKVDSLTLSHDTSGADFLLAKMEWMACKALDPGFVLTSDPALPATANTDPFQTLTRTWDYGSGNLALTGLEKVEIHVINGLNAVYSDSYVAGAYTGHWAYDLLESNRQAFLIELDLQLDTVERALWDELLSLTNTKELYFKWTRSTNDYISVTATDCQVVDHEVITEGPKGRKVVHVQLIPRDLAFEVKDSIAGGAYNE